MMYSIMMINKKGASVSPWRIPERILKDSISPSGVIIDDRLLGYKTLMVSIVSIGIPQSSKIF